MKPKEIIQYLFTYKTIEKVKIRDTRLKLFHISLIFLVLVFVSIYQMVIKKGYMHLDAPTAGSISISMRSPKFDDFPDVEDLDYCDPDKLGDSMKCIYWTLPTNCKGSACLLPTRLNITTFDKKIDGCEEMGLMTIDKECSFDPLYTKENRKMIEEGNGYYAANAEFSTIYIDHSVRGINTNTVFGYDLNGKLIDKEKKTIKKFKKGDRMQNKIITVNNLLQAANTTLEKLTVSNDKTLESNRYGGVVLLVIIDYEILWYAPTQIEYIISVEEVPDTDYKVIGTNPLESINSSTFIITTVHGVWMIFKQSGSLGKFDVYYMFINVVANLAFIRFTKYMVEICMLYLLPNKSKYYNDKYEIIDKQGNNQKGVVVKSNLDFI